MTPEMEILEAEIEGGILAGSGKEVGDLEEGGARQDGAGFEEDDEDF